MSKKLKLRTLIQKIRSIKINQSKNNKSFKNKIKTTKSKYRSFKINLNSKMKNKKKFNNYKKNILKLNKI